MANITLKLTDDDGKVTVFTKTRIKARAIRKALEANVKIEKYGKENDYGGQLDAMVDFVVDFFNDKELTADAIWDGLDKDELQPTLQGIFSDVLGVAKDDGDEPKKS